MSITWSKSDVEDEEKKENKIKAFTGKYETSSDTSYEDAFDEDLTETYKHLLSRWEEFCLVIKKQKKTIETLIHDKEVMTTTITNLEEEATLLINIKQGI
ncbi:hypothetical protein A2U01_0021783 [Trifolium medium]|uniref:Gag-pol polyprotein n=1 Tax=Trifolium medium TaxID=97028 RepID=A0A392NLQ3_9FABA|nr:hypothetical protein [Trifolium medium]